MTFLSDGKHGCQPLFMSLLVASILLLNACATERPKNTLMSSAPRKTIGSESTVAVLRPLLVYERIHDETIVPASDYDGDAIGTKIVTVARNVIGSRRIALRDAQGQNKRDEIMYQTLNANIPRLSRGIVGKDAGALLNTISTNAPHILVLVSYVKVKIGSDGSWNPSSGAITSSNSKTILQASLIQAATGEVLWVNQVLLRETPNLADSIFTEALDLLFSRFPHMESKK